MCSARSRACGSARSCIQPCSSHSLMAPASCSTLIAHARSVRITGRRSRVNIINIAPERDESIGPAFRSGAANAGQGFEIGVTADFPPVPPTCAKHYLIGSKSCQACRCLGSLIMLWKVPVPEHSGHGLTSLSLDQDANDPNRKSPCMLKAVVTVRAVKAKFFCSLVQLGFQAFNEN